LPCPTASPTGISRPPVSISDTHGREIRPADDHERTSVDTMPVVTRTSGARFSLTIDGVAAASPKLVTGGDAVGDVVEEKVGPDGIALKHIAGVRYTDIEVTCGPDMAAPLKDWIQATLARSYLRKGGSVGLLDLDGAERTRLDFVDALLTEIGFPGLDAASKDAALLHLKLSPEWVRRLPGSGPEVGLMKPKTWTVGGFRVDITNLETKRVARVEPFVVRLALEDQAVGEVRDFAKAVARIEVPDLVVTLPESDAATWRDWHEDFVVKGNCTQDRERTGTLQLLSIDLKTPVLQLSFDGLGIYSLTTNSAATPEALPTVRASMYCEGVGVTFPAG
jgi:hypothetical protein